MRVSYYAIAVQCLDLAVGADIPAVLSNWNELLYTLHHVRQDNQVRALHDLVVCNCSVHAYTQQKYTVIRPTNRRQRGIDQPISMATGMEGVHPLRSHVSYKYGWMKNEGGCVE